MATQTLVQYLAPDAGVVMNRQQVETFVAGGTIAAGDWVVFDTSASDDSDILAVVVAGAAATSPLCVGCALTGATGGKRLDVVISGWHPAAKTSARHAVGARVTCGADAKGALLPAQSDTDPAGPDAHGVVLIQPSSGDYTAAGDRQPVWVYKRF